MPELPEVEMVRRGMEPVLTGRRFERDSLLADVLDDLSARYDAWLGGGLAAIYEGLAPRDFLRGRRVSVDGVAGKAELVDRDGRLEIRTDEGQLVHVESGEVHYER